MLYNIHCIPCILQLQCNTLYSYWLGIVAQCTFHNMPKTLHTMYTQYSMLHTLYRYTIHYTV